MAPTRELAQQIMLAMRALGDYMGVKFHMCIGGTSMRDDKQKLTGGVQVIVGTPGRVNDMIRRGVLKTDKIKMFVLEEADEMLSSGFKDQIYDVFKTLPDDVQVILMSTTIPSEVLEMIKKFMRDPIQILIKKDESPLEGIRQFYISIEKEELKFESLCDLFDEVNITQVLIFCNARKKVDDLARNLQQKKFTVSHSFIGHSGRFGRKGVAINFVTKKDQQMLCELESYYSTKIEEMPADIGKIIF